MNWRTCFLLTLSTMATGGLSCRGPETGALNPEIAAESDKPGPAQISLGTETPKSEIAARLPESNHNRQSRTDKMRYEKELITLAGLAASFL